MDEKDKKTKDKEMASTIYEGCGWIKEHVPELTMDEFLFIDKIESECSKIMFDIV